MIQKHSALKLNKPVNSFNISSFLIFCESSVPGLSKLRTIKRNVFNMLRSRAPYISKLRHSFLFAQKVCFRTSIIAPLPRLGSVRHFLFSFTLKNIGNTFLYFSFRDFSGIGLNCHEYFFFI